MIKAVIFDLDNTLYDENEYFLKVFKDFSKKHGLDYISIKRLFTDEFRLKSRDIFTDMLILIDYYSEKNQNELFELYKTINHPLKLYCDAYEIIKFIASMNIKMAVITNGVVAVQKNKVKVLGVQNNIKNIIYARELGVEREKPNPKPFLKALEILNVRPSEALYIGDHPMTDIKGACNVGMNAVRFMNGYASKIDYNHNHNISNLHEIKSFLKE